MGNIFNFIFNLGASKAGIFLTEDANGNPQDPEPVIIDVVMQQMHDNRATVTRNPIESGAVVSDHIVIEPVVIVFDGVLSDNPLGYPFTENVDAIVGTEQTLFGQTRRSIELYNRLLDLQTSKRTFRVTTSYKKYDNMFLESISAPKSARNGDAVIFSATMTQLLFVESQRVNVGNIQERSRDIASPMNDRGSNVSDPIPVDNPDSSNAAAITDFTKQIASASAYAALMDKGDRVF